MIRVRRRSQSHSEPAGYRSAARLLEGAFVSIVEENELSMPAVEQLYAALGEVEVAVSVLEAGLWRGPPVRGVLRAGARHGVSHTGDRIVWMVSRFYDHAERSGRA